mgnify:FL=1
MKVNDCINLENGKSYLLLMESTIDNTKYFLSVGINAQEEPTNEYLVLQEVIENNEEYVIPINNPVILSNLINEFKQDYDDEYN